MPEGTRTPIDDDGDGTIDRIEFDFDEDGNIDRTAHVNADGRWERVERDLDDDGNIDRIDHYTFAADGTGRVTRRDFDLDDDGNIDRTAHVNADGRWERVELDADDDGNIDRVDHYTFAADGTGRVTRRDFDDDGDGNIDRSETYRYNSDGGLIRTGFDDNGDGNIDRIAFDPDGDGNIDRINHYTFAANGNGRVTRRDFDLDDDGTIDRTAHVNADGRWERVERDLDDDGNIDRIDHYTFAADGTGRLTRRDFDDDGDGNIDRSETYIYDADGNIDRSETYIYDADGNINQTRFDDDGDGNIDRSETYRYNSDGGLIRTGFDDNGDGNIDRIAFDPDGDGNIDRINHYTFAADGTGRVTRRDFDLDDDGTIDRTAHVNADGRWERVERDLDDDGNIDRIDHYTFAADGTGRLTRRDFDDDGDGNFDRSEAYRYNSDGNRIQTRFDDDNDGNIDRIAFDPDGDGNFDRINHYTFAADGTGRVTRRDFDLDDDGTIDRTAHVNADGRWERVERDLDDDGNIDRIDHYTFAADGTGRLTRRDFDDDGDGNFDRSEAYIYNGDGNRIQTRFDDDNDGNIDRIAFDPDGDGNFDRINHYTIDDDGNGRVTRRDFDLDDDGNIDRIAHVNADGRWERVERDADDDGNIDRIDHYTFAADGTRSLTRTGFDDDGDGNIDRSEAYTHGGDGNRIRTDFDDDNDGNIDRIAFDPDGDGNIDRINHYTFAADGTGRVTRRDFDLDDDGTIDRTAHVNADGRWERVERDLDDDGNIDRIDHYTFAVDGTRSLTRRDFDDDADGTADRSEAYTYNSGGTLIRTAFDDNNDGTIDRTAFDSDGDGTADRIDHYTYDDYGARRMIRRDFDDDDDGTINRTAHLNAEGRWERVDLDADDDGNIDRSNHYTFAADGAQSLTRTAFDTDGDGDLDRVSYEGDADFAGDFPNHAGLEVVRLGFVGGGDGFTTLTIPDGFVFAGASGSRVRIEGGSTDTLRFDMDDFTEGDRVIVEGQDYRSFAADDGSWSFLVDADVTLIDPTPVFTSPAAASVAENQSAAYMAVATDEDSSTLVYSLSGTDAALFTIDANTGEVSFIAAPDFEAPGDDGGDNVYDIVVTASDGSNHTEQAIAITVTDGYDPDLSALDGSNGFILSGIDAFDQSGRSVSSAGDVNGDGYDDLIIGTPGGDPNGPGSGESYIVYGGASAPGTDGVLDLSDLDGTNGFILNGIDASDFSGISVSSAGDVNGDGYDDLIIGALYADPNGDRSGETYIVYGGASAPGTGGRFNLSDLDGSNGFILNGIDVSDRSGWSVSSAGDINGDGYDDLLIGANRADPNGRNYAGETYIVYGGASAPGTGGVLDLGALDGTNGFILTGVDAYDNSGISVSSAGDVNGDGYDDLVIGAPFADPNGDNSGESYVVYGGANAPGTGGVLDLSTLNGSNGFTLTGIDAGDRAGRSVSSAGDVNGDGYDDLIIGADRADPNGDSSGETYVVYGGASAPGTDGVLDLSILGTNGFILTGIDAGDYSGWSVSSAGDVNGDGYDDLIIGALYADPNGDRSGETYIVYGGASAPGTDGVLDLSDLDGTNGFILNGIDASDFSGVSVSSAGDVNGDGYDDLIIGALYADPNGDSDAGETYILYGGATGTESLTPVTASGTAAADNFTGNAGADSFTAIATDDVVRGGAGDDNIRVTALDFAAIDGGTGVDTLVLDGAGLALDLTGAGHAGVDSVEVFDLSGTGANSLVLDAQAVFDVTEEREDGIASLDVLGDADDRVDLSGSNFALSGTATEDGVTYHVYRDGNAQLRIEDGVQVQNPRLITLSVAEGQIAARYRAPDVEGETLVYSLSGADAARFTIDANTGEVRFREVPDFEAPGDADGDNVYDIIATVSDGTTDTEQAVAIRVTDEYDLVPLSTLDGTNGFTLNGIDASDYSGFSVSSAGDVNGDGYDDLIIGARNADPNGDIWAGETYVIYGGASAPGSDGVLDLSSLDGTNGFTLTGIDAFDQSGRSVSSAGDVNGDGYDDLIIGAWGGDPNGNSYAGETYVIYGGASAPGSDGELDLSALDGSNGFILNGIDAGDQSGFSVSSAGDVNGDGYDDLIIGAFRADPNRNNYAGATYVVYGGANAPGTEGVLDLGALDGSNGFILNGINAVDLSGRSVSSAGDVNGDGYDDLIIGAFFADPNGVDRAGETYIVYGGASAPGTDGVLDLSALDGSNGFILNGIDGGDSSGWSVSSAGDVNGDGYDDLVIGARLADPNGSNSGETYVVYGGASAPGTGGVLNLGALDGSNGFILNGISFRDYSGFSVSSAGDVNGDGYDDLIIGAYLANPNGDFDAGETYIVYGGASAPGTGGVLDLSDLDGSNGFILTGIDADDHSGSSVASAGDVNGDGYDDLIIGAFFADPNGDSNAGETYVVYGGATGTESLTPVTASGTAAADNFTGNAGADSFTAIATDDVVRGGAGDDNISVTALDFAAIDGGTGVDTLVLDGAGLALDLTGPGNAGVDNVEVFDLSGTGANTLVLDAQAVFDVTEERAGGVASLDVLGDADDRVDLSGSSFALTGTVTEDGVTYNVYRDGNAQLRIEDGVQVQNPRLITLSVAEGQIAARYRAPDVEGETLVYSLSGADAALFTIDANTGEVRFREAPDFEMPGDADGDNVYDIIATVSDGTTDTEQAVAIRVTNENDNIPVFTSPTAVSVAENQTAAYEAAVTDADGDTLVYSLSGTDAARFTIDANTGAVRFRAAPDFEAPGDDGGDNVYDIVVTASDGSNHTEQAVAITVTDGYDLDLAALDGSNGFILNGIDAADYSGRSVSSAGDVNGDGYDDLIIGAPSASPNGANRAGETYVIYGGANAPGMDGELDLSDLDGSNGFTLTGIDRDDQSGFSVSSAGDVNGDGYDDLIIGAWRRDTNARDDGEAYIIYGGANAPGREGVLDLSDLDGSNGFTLTGVYLDDHFGYSVSSAGDVNGDGYDDLIIGARGGNPDGQGSGETYVIYGGVSAPGTDGVLDLSTLDGSNGFILNGISFRDYSGFSVSSAGDVNGDGYDDLIIGAWGGDPNGNSYAGETYVIYGGASAPGSDGVLDLGALDGTNGFILNGIDVRDYSGQSVSAAGDVNGDGYDDLIIGAWQADPNGESSGESYVIYGGASAPGTNGELDLSALDGSNGFILNGIDAGDQSGFSVSSAGDVNGDGYDDLIIGAFRADPNGDTNAGETYIVYGGASAPGSDGVLNLSSRVLDGSTGFIVNGIDRFDYSGRSVSAAGDVNGDGYDDLIIGANRADSQAGESYVIYGGATGTENLVPVTASGTAAADNFTGNAGADSFTAIATDDVVRGGAGDDNIRVTSLDFAAIDGGTGVDTLVLDGAGLALDLTGPGHAGVDSVEVFDLSGTGANSLVLDAQAVFDVTEEREGGVASLDVRGDADDRVDLSGSNFALAGTVAEDGVTYNVYRDGNAQLRIEDGVQVQNPRLITLSVAEGQIAARYRAPDVAGETLVYSLSGTDAALFTIDANTGEVRFRAAPDFEAPDDADGDNVYDIIATVSDGTTDTEQVVAIRVTNENDNAPVFTSPVTANAQENQFAAYEAAATDGDGDTLVYSLSGTDAALFTIDADRGAVRFREAPDFEAPGDDGGDNVYDVVVTASDGTTDTEQAVAITVTDSYDPDLASLDGTNGFILNGIDSADNSGRSVSSAGDVNGDGYDDLIIGADNASPNGNFRAGETYVVYGGANAPGTDGVLDLSTLDGTNGFTLNGIDASDYSGWSVSSAGDVNGDGYDDLIIGTRGTDPNGDDRAGETYIVYGVPRAPGTDGVLDLSDLDGTNGFTLTGIDARDYSGWSVSSAGDVNGDGYDDLIIGAWQADPNGDRYAGKTYVIYGGANAPGTGGVLDLGALDGSNGFILNGIDRGDQSGYSVSSAGDVNGDGYDDLVIGAPGGFPNGVREAGETYVVYGGATAPGSDGVLDLSDLDGTNGFILNGIDRNDRSGRSVSSAGDVNGDGYDDLIIGAPGGFPNGVREAGETYVVYGGASAPGTGGRFNLSDLDGSNGFIVNGIDENDDSGWSVSSAGDVNGDGYDDLIIAARSADPNGRDRAGETYVVYGGASAPGSDGVLDLSSLALDGSTGFIVNGSTYDQSGWSVSSAGDVNGDGYDDLVIGANRADSQAGESYVLYGGATGTESLTPVTAQGMAAADNFTGNAGADSFTAIATDDVVRGGAGNDRISVTALDFAAIDGGTGVDTLVLDGAGLALDLTGAGHAGVDSVEVFDLSGTGANSLVLDALAVFDVTEEREDGLASLDVLGDADDRVDLGGSNFILTGTATEDGVTYHVYRDGNAQLRIENGVSVTLAAAGSQSARSLTADPDRILPDLSHADAREGIDGTGLYSPGHSPGMDVDFMDGFSEPEFEWTGVVVTGLAPPDMEAPDPLSSGQAINLFDALTGYDLSYDLLL